MGCPMEWKKICNQLDRFKNSFNNALGIYQHLQIDFLIFHLLNPFADQKRIFKAVLSIFVGSEIDDDISECGFCTTLFQLVAYTLAT